MNQCYSVIANSSLVGQLGLYHQKLKAIKREIKMVKQWSPLVMEKLSDCLYCRDWSVFSRGMSGL